jgi:Tfp pilus assembly protein PilP
MKRSLPLLFVALVAMSPVSAGAIPLALEGATDVDSAQAPADAPTGAKPQTPPAETAPSPPANYAYSHEGRRDPFVSLVNRGAEARTTMAGRAKPDGVRGLLVEEVVVRGLVQSQGTWVAMIGAPTGRTYSIRPGDRLLDGSVRAITGQAVVLMQEVNDPLSLEKQREVRKYLRGEVK